MKNKVLVFFTIIIVIIAVCVVIFVPKSNGENAKLSEVVQNDYTVEDYTNPASCCSTDVYSSSSSSCCGSATSSIPSCCQ